MYFCKRWIFGFVHRHFHFCKWCLQSCAVPCFSHSSLCFSVHPCHHIWSFSPCCRVLHFSQPHSSNRHPACLWLHTTTHNTEWIASNVSPSGFMWRFLWDVYPWRELLAHGGYVTKWDRGIPQRQCHHPAIGSAWRLPWAHIPHKALSELASRWGWMIAHCSFSLFSPEY